MKVLIRRVMQHYNHFHHSSNVFVLYQKINRILYTPVKFGFFLWDIVCMNYSYTLLG